MALIVVFCLCFLYGCSFLEEDPQKSAIYLRGRINTEFGIELSAENSDVLSYDSIISRDFTYFVSFTLSSDKNEELKNSLLSDNTWIKTKDNPLITNTYELNCSDKILDPVKNACTQKDSYAKIDKSEEDRFSIIIFNPEESLFIYYVSTW